MPKTPSPTGANGRDSKGRFVSGNKYALGNPHAKRVQDVRTALLDTVTYEDVQEIVRSLVDQAKAGDVQAAKEVLDRCLGRVKQSVDVKAEVSPSGRKHIEDMTDLELIRELRAGGLTLPPLLELKAQQLEAEASLDS